MCGFLPGGSERTVPRNTGIRQSRGDATPEPGQNRILGVVLSVAAKRSSCGCPSAETAAAVRPSDRPVRGASRDRRCRPSVRPSDPCEAPAETAAAARPSDPCEAPAETAAAVHPSNRPVRGASRDPRCRPSVRSVRGASRDRRRHPSVRSVRGASRDRRRRPSVHPTVQIRTSIRPSGRLLSVRAPSLSGSSGLD